MSPSQIAIIGAGAIGTALAARLAASGARVLVVARGARARQIAATGVVLKDRTGTHAARPEVCARLTAPVSVMFLCVKCGSLRAAVEENIAGLGPDTRVVPLVNGIPWWFYGEARRPVAAVDPDGRLLDLVPLDQIVGAVTAMTAMFDDDGQTVRSTIPHKLVLGPIVPGGPRPVDLAEALAAAGFALNRAD